MGRPSKQPPVASSLVSSIVRHAVGAGLDLGTLSLRFGLPAEVLALDETVVSPEVPDELLHEVARMAGEPDVAVRIASELTSGPARCFTCWSRPCLA